MTAPSSSSKGVTIPPDIKTAVIAALRTAKYGEVATIGQRFGLSRTRLYYYRKLAGVRFSSAERAAYLKTRPTAMSPARRIPKTIGVPDRPRLHDFTEEEWSAFHAKTQREEIEEPLRRILLCEAARQGDVNALRELHARYSKLRLPLVEAQLTPEQRAQLPWLQGNGNG